MLGYLRGRASGIVIKTIFGLLILSFVLFYGYTQITQSESRTAVASVNGQEIPAAFWRIRLDESLAQIRRSSGGNVSPEIEKFFRSNLIQQMISNTLRIQWAKKIGLEPPETRIAAAIAKTPALIRDGVFDETFYRLTWRRYVHNQYGRDFEEMLADDLAVEKMQNLMTAYSLIGEGEVDQTFKARERKIELEGVAVPFEPEKDETSSKAFTQAQLILKAVLQGKKRLKSVAAGHGLAVKQTGLHGFKEQQELIRGTVSLDNWEKIVGLKVKEFLPEPIKVDNRWLVIRKLAERDGPPTGTDVGREELKKSLAATLGMRLETSFMEPFRKDSKIDIFAGPER